MTKAQQQLYFCEWGAVRRHLMVTHGWRSCDADKFRHTLHIRALGYAKSSTAFTNAEFDHVLGVFRAIATADDVEAQLRQLEQPLTRHRRVLSDLAAELKLSPAYLDSMCLRIAKRSHDDCSAADLVKVIAALNYHRAREHKRQQERAAWPTTALAESESDNHF